MKILVTGGAGFIGSHLVDSLVEKGHELVVVDNLSTGKRENVNKKATLYEVDISSERIEEIFKKEKPEVVFHFAAQIDVRKSVEDPKSSAETNILGSVNILESIKKYCSKETKVVFASTGGAIYGDASITPTPESYKEEPLSPYGIEKLTVDKYLNYYHLNFGTPYISLRLGNIYGPRQNPHGEAGVVAIFANKMINREQVVVNGDGKNTRDFVFVDDVVEASILAMETKKSGVYNIGTGKETDVNAIFHNLKININEKAQESYGPAKAGEQKRSCLDATKAEEELRWKAKTGVEEGIRVTADWFKKNN